jgi:hypothetical protein
VRRTEALVVRAFAVWTVYVWGTRIWNILGDSSTSTAFKVVHSVLALVSVVFAAAAWVVVSRVRRRTEVAARAADAGTTS